jgi:hypothetical protein
MEWGSQLYRPENAWLWKFPYWVMAASVCIYFLYVFIICAWWAVYILERIMLWFCYGSNRPLNRLPVKLRIADD